MKIVVKEGYIGSGRAGGRSRKERGGGGGGERSEADRAVQLGNCCLVHYLGETLLCI